MPRYNEGILRPLRTAIPMKSQHWHRCAICGKMNAGVRLPDSTCQHCRRSTFIHCPECRKPLVGRQFRCCKCRSQLTWRNCVPLPYEHTTDNAVSRPFDRRIEHLEPAYAASLVAENISQGDLVIRELKQVSHSLFDAFAAFPGTLHLPDVTAINLRPDIPIARCKLKGLYLDGVTKITPETLKPLMSIPADLSLCGISHIPKELAESVRERRHCTLLHGISEIDDEAATVLAEAEGTIQLDWLPEDDCPAVLRARFYNRELHQFQKTIRSLSPTCARELRRQLDGKTLDLSGLLSLPPITASELTGSHDLRLDGLPAIDEDLAEALGEHEGLLALDGIPAVTREAARRLTKKPRKVSLRNVKNFPLEALATAAEKRPNLTVRLYSLKELSIKHARKLSQLPVHIELDSGGCLTIDAAREFCNQRARLTIKMPETVSGEVRDFVLRSPCSNIRIDATTELQRKLAALSERLVPASGLQQVRIDDQTHFSEADTEHVHKFHGRLRIVFNNQIHLDHDATKRFSHWKCDLTFLSVGKLEDAALSLLLTHSSCMIFDGIELSDDQASLIAQEKEQGRLEVPSYLNDLSERQIELLSSNPRVIVS